MSASCCGGGGVERRSQSEAAGESGEQRRPDIKWLVRPMRQDDIEKCLFIWLQVELTEARQTVASALATDPGGFYVAELEDSGEVIGMCASTLTREDTAFMGFYAVEPNYQGIGVGRELWAQTLKRLDESMNIGLYGVPAMSAKYKKSGFQVEDSVRMLIFESQPGQELRLDLLTTTLDELMASCNSTAEARSQGTYSREQFELLLIDSNTSEFVLSKLFDYDALVNRFSRKKLLQHYLTNKDADTPLTLALVRKTTSPSSSSRSRFDDASANNSNEHKAPSCCETSNSTTEEAARLSNQMSASLSLERDEQDQEETLEVLGYGCVRHDNTDGGMIGPIYAQSSVICEFLLANLLDRFELKPRGKFSAMSLTSNSSAGEILERIGLHEMDQCSRMFTKFVPEASSGKIFYVHSPNFTLF